MKQLLKPTFWAKTLVLLLILVQFVCVAVFVFWLADYSFNANNGTYALLSALVLFITDIVFGIAIFNSDSPNAYKLTWLFAVFALPIAGILMYVFWANKSTSKSQKKKVAKFERPVNASPSTALEALQEKMPDYCGLVRYLDLAAGSGAHQQTSSLYFDLVDKAYPVILEELAKAKHYIFLEFFIIGEGEMWGGIEKILIQKVSQGVDVRIIYDDVGSLQCAPDFFDARLRKKGIECRKFNPWRPFMDVRLNNRDHRKMIVIDGHTAFSGGFNLADEYINRIDRFGHWKDNAIMLKGKAVENFTYMFLANWKTYFFPNLEIDKAHYSSKTFIDEIGGYPENDGFVAPYGDIPYQREAVGERVYLGLMARAKKSVYMATPYLILDEEMINSICFSAKEGLDVRLLVPHIPDKKMVFNLTRSYYEKLLEAGVKIYEYTPGFVHEKMFVIDDNAASVGTINLDYRSFFLHMENGTLFLDSSSIQQMKKDFLQTIEVSHEVTLQEWKRWKKRNRCYWAMLRLISPIL